jgi:hypothetical protein
MDRIGINATDQPDQTAALIAVLIASAAPAPAQEMPQNT